MSTQASAAEYMGAIFSSSSRTWTKRFESPSSVRYYSTEDARRGRFAHCPQKMSMQDVLQLDLSFVVQL